MSSSFIDWSSRSSWLRWTKLTDVQVVLDTGCRVSSVAVHGRSSIIVLPPCCCCCFWEFHCAAGLITGHITGLACPSVCPVRAFITQKTKGRKKTKIIVTVPQGMGNWCANFSSKDQRSRLWLALGMRSADGRICRYLTVVFFSLMVCRCRECRYFCERYVKYTIQNLYVCGRFYLLVSFGDCTYSQSVQVIDWACKNDTMRCCIFNCNLRTHCESNKKINVAEISW